MLTPTPQTTLTALASTLRGILEDALRDERVEPGSVEVSFDRPNADGFTRSTVNFYLYDLAENAQLREASWADSVAGGRGVHQLRRSPARMDVSYRVSAWTQRPEDEQDLLWIALGALHRASPIPPERFGEELARWMKRPVRTQVAQSGGAMGSLTEFWGAVGGPFRPSFNLTATLELSFEPLAIGEVYDKAVTQPPQVEVHGPGVHLFGQCLAHGAGAEAAEGALPTPALLTLLDRGRRLLRGDLPTTTDGRFELHLGRLMGGAYLLQAQATDGATGEITVEVPSLSRQISFVKRDLRVHLACE